MADQIDNASNHDLLRQIAIAQARSADAQEETNKKLARLEIELLGTEGDRSGGAMFRLAKVETQVALLWASYGVIGTATVILVVTKIITGVWH